MRSIDIVFEVFVVYGVIGFIVSGIATIIIAWINEVVGTLTELLEILISIYLGCVVAIFFGLAWVYLWEKYVENDERSITR